MSNGLGGLTSVFDPSNSAEEAAGWATELINRIARDDNDPSAGAWRPSREEQAIVLGLIAQIPAPPCSPGWLPWEPSDEECNLEAERFLQRLLDSLPPNSGLLGYAEAIEAASDATATERVEWMRAHDIRVQLMDAANATAQDLQNELPSSNQLYVTLFALAAIYAYARGR
jgi:hypothetical protein